MTFAVFSRTDALVSRLASRFQRPFSIAGWLFAILAILVVLTGLLLALPDGLAEPLQTLIGWAIGGVAAAGAVLAIVKGLERLLDCETN